MLQKRHEVVHQLYQHPLEQSQPELSMHVESHGFTPVDSETLRQVTAQTIAHLNLPCDNCTGQLRMVQFALPVLQSLQSGHKQMRNNAKEVINICRRQQTLHLSLFPDKMRPQHSRTPMPGG